MKLPPVLQRWYLASNNAGSNNMVSSQSFQGSWTQWANGQTLTGAYKPNTMINANVGPVAIQFQDSTNATLTLPGGRQVPITRFKF